MNNKESLPGVSRFAVILLLTNFAQLVILMGFDRYKYMFHYLPDNAILIRYTGSLLLRVITITSVLGVLYYKDFFRKVLIYISIFIVLTFYWRHPYAAFVNYDQYYHLTPDRFNAYMTSIFGSPVFSYQQVKVSSMIFAYVTDICIYGSLLYYLNQPAVKSRFK